MTAGEHRAREDETVDVSRSPESANRSRVARSFARAGSGGEARSQGAQFRELGPCEDIRSLVHISTAYIAGFTFDTPLSTSASASVLIEQLYNAPSRCLEASLKLALHLDRSTTDSIVGLPLGEVLPRRLGYDELFARWHAAALSGNSFEVEVFAPDTSPLVMQAVVYARIVEGSFSRIWVILRDVTVHARAVQALARAELHYRSLVERPGLMLVRFRPDGWYEYMSPAVQELLGYSIRDFNAHPRLILDLIHPEDVARLESLGLSDINDSTQLVEREFRLKLADGTYNWFLSRCSPKRSANGEVEYIDLICMNIQKHKELEQEVTQRAKALIVSQTAAGIAHDLNNYLTVIRSQVENGIHTISPEHPAYNSLQEAQRAITACSHMARQLLDVGRTVPRQTVQVSVSSLLREAATLSKHLMTPSTTLQVDPCDEDLLIECAPAELQQALMNLILNARDALNESGVVILNACEISQEKQEAPPRVAITVRDNGSGIAPQVIGRIFEPYFTTKEGRGGTGLGLSNVRTAIELQGGTIEVYSTEGVGTEFRIMFPLVRGHYQQPATPVQVVPENEAGLSVLVADDDEGVRNILLSNIARMGHRAYGVSDGQALLAMVQEGIHSYDAIILDDSMPKARGLDLIPRLSALTPRTQVILTSGDPRIKSAVAQFNPAPLFLAKPFGLKELRDALAGGSVDE